jgi:hypothetical protein
MARVRRWGDGSAADIRVAGLERERQGDQARPMLGRDVMR